MDWATSPDSNGQKLEGKMVRFLLALALSAVLAGCVTNDNRPAPGSTLVGERVVSSSVMLFDTFPNSPRAKGPWHGFANAEHYLVLGGKQPTVEEVADDLRRREPRLFKSQYARTQFVRAMAQFRPDVKTAEDLANLLLTPGETNVVSCEGKLTTLAYNSGSFLKQIARDCVKGELLVELKVGGKWQSVFSLGCLNPLDGPIAQVIEDPCGRMWPVPTGSQDNGSVIVFVPREAIPCLPPASVCQRECERWMNGFRGRPDDQEVAAALRKMISEGGGAYRVPRGTTEVRLPTKTMSVDPAIWCDEEVHRTQEAHFMEGVQTLGY